MQERKYVLTIMVAIVLVFLGTTTAKADAIWIDTYELPSALGNTAAEATFIELEEGLGYDLTFLFKIEDRDPPDPDVEVPGALDGSYFTVSALGSPTATVSWNLAGTDYELLYILLKDGTYDLDDNGDKGTLYALYRINPDQNISSNGSQTIGFWNDATDDYIPKGISHISFFGDYSEGNQLIPEPTTLLLLGTGLLGIGFAFRNRMKP